MPEVVIERSRQIWKPCQSLMSMDMSSEKEGQGGTEDEDDS